MPPPVPPDYGYGPADFSSQGAGDPFGNFDNRIRYNDMVRYQMISQYQQENVQPASMTLSQYRQIASNPKYQYGVQGGQNARFYQRQAELRRMSYGATASTVAMDLVSWGVSAGVLGSMGIGSAGMLGGLGMAGLGGVALTMFAPMAPMYFVNKGVQNALNRQKFMHSMASDIDQNRQQLGLGNMGYGEVTELARGLTSSMYKPGQFFNREQQSEIHKIAISNNLITAKSVGLNSGSIKQYQRNMEELIKTTEDIVKLLQTTKEGGLSIIKELKQTGFGSIGQIRQQVLQAKAFGGLTGLGAQNMMQIGAEGAAAVQGTPWTAATGAGMYQFGAAQAGMLAQTGPRGAATVERAGGIASAGGAIGRFAMNMLSSGIGSKLSLYAMKPDGSIDNARMQRLLAGGVGAYEIVSGANSVGYGMGQNKVRFDMFKADMMANLTPDQQMKMVNAGFQAWGSQRPYSSYANKAAVFAGMYTNDFREKELIYRSLLNPTGAVQMAGSQVVEYMALNQAQRSRVLGPTGRSIVGAAIGFTNYFNDMGTGIVEQSYNAMTGAVNMARGVVGGVGRAGEWLGIETGILSPYGFINRANYGDYGAAVRRRWGVEETTMSAKAAFSTLSPQQLNNMLLKPIKRADIVIRPTATSEQINYAEQKILNSLMMGNAETVYQDPGIRAVFGNLGTKIPQINATKINAYSNFMTGSMARNITPVYREPGWESRIPKDNTARVNAYLLDQINEKRTSVTAEWNRVQGEIKTQDTNDGKLQKQLNEGIKNIQYYGKIPERYPQIDPTVKKALDLFVEKKRFGEPTVGFGEFKTIDIQRLAKEEEASLNRIFSPRTNINRNTDFMFTGATPIIYSQWRSHVRRMKKMGFNIETLTGKREALKRRIELEDRPGSWTKSEIEFMKGTETLFEGTTREQLAGALEKITMSEAAPEAQRRFGFVASAMAKLGALEKDPDKEVSKRFKFKDEEARKDFESKLTLAVTGQMKAADYRKLGKAYPKHLTELGLEPGKIENQLKELEGRYKGQETAVAQRMGAFITSSIDPISSMSLEARKDQIFKSLEILRDLKQDSKKQIADIDYEGKKVTVKKEDVEKELEKAKESKEKLTMDIMLQGLRQGAQGRSLDATVRPPVLNYWNNRWVL